MWESQRIQKLNRGINLSIPAGETTASLAINGIEEVPENDEEDETIILNPSANNGFLTSEDPLTLTIKNNALSLIKKDNPFPNLSKGAVSWGDYDRDGDKI